MPPPQRDPAKSAAAVRPRPFWAAGMIPCWLSVCPASAPSGDPDDSDTGDEGAAEAVGANGAGCAVRRMPAEMPAGEGGEAGDETHVRTIRAPLAARGCTDPLPITPEACGPTSAALGRRASPPATATQ